MKRWAFILLISIVTLATFGPIVSHDFVSWDDPETIRDNPRLNPPTIGSIGYYWRNQAWGLYVPLTYTFWGAIAAVARGGGTMDPAAFHAFSVVLHILSALIVFSILRGLSASERGAWIGALLFAVHPMQVETIAWASGAKDLLGGLFSLVCVHQYILFARHAESRRKAVMHYCVAAAALVLGMLAKPIAVVAPVIALVIDVALVRHDLRLALRSCWPLIVLTIPCVIWSRIAQNIWPQTVVDWWQRPLVAGDALGFYLYKLVWPMSLSSFYGRTPQVVLQSNLANVAWIVPVLVLAAPLLSRERRTELLAGAAVFVIALLPVLGFTPFMYQLHSTVADHYMYLPMVGVALVAAVGVSARPTRGVILLSGVLLTLLGVRSALQLRHWRDDVAWASRGVALNPRSFDANVALGAALASRGHIERALPHLRFCADARPDSALAQQLLAQALVFTNQFEQAVAPARAALDLAAAGGSADLAWEHFLLGTALVGAGQAEQGQRHLDIAVRLRPGLASPLRNQ
jgi:hypothetical protein